MSRQEAEPSTRARPRANTTSFTASLWSRRPRAEQTVLNPSICPQFGSRSCFGKHPLNLSPLPLRETLNPILVSLCSAESPPSVQAAGYDILSAYWENHEALSLGTAERLSYFSLFLGTTTSWGMELWEPRFKALRALTRYGIDIIGIENHLIDVLQWWIEGAFEGLLKVPAALSIAPMTERERSLDLLMADVLHFYASLVDRSIVIPDPTKELPSSPTSTAAPAPTTRHSSLGHRRNHPAELATNLYLSHLSAHIKTLPPVHLNSILPLLFRALAFCAAPLPRLSKNTLEDRITETLNSLFQGPYATSCMLILKSYLFPPCSAEDKGALTGVNQPSQPSSPAVAIMTTLGANRTFRNYVRRALSARLARAYISREASIGYSHSGAPGHMALQVDLLEKAWPKEDYTPSSIGIGGNGWDAARLGRTLAESVGAWIDYRFDDATLKNDSEKRLAWEKEQQGKDEILEEAAGVLKDILQELDLRDEEHGMLDEEEAGVVGLTLLKLSGYLLPLKNPDGTPFTIPIEHPHDAPTPILRTISSLLARDHSRALNPLLSSILIHVAEHLTDADTARLPHLMMEQHDLSPTSPEWLDNWKNLLANETLVSPFRPQTRRAIMDTLHHVYESVKDMRVYRRPLADLIWTFCGGLVGCAGDQSDDADVTWKLIGEEIVLRSDERGEDDAADMAELTNYLDLLVSVASEKPEEDGDSIDTASVYTNDTHSPSANMSSSPSANVSPSITRVQTEFAALREREKDSGMPSVMSILSSLTAGGTTSRSQSVQPQYQEDANDVKGEPYVPARPGPPLIPRDVSATAALVEIFSQLVFTPFSLGPKNLLLAVRVYEMLLAIITDGKSMRARVTALQFLVRLRADRDHNLYYVSEGYDTNGLIASLGALINRVDAHPTPGANRGSEDSPPEGIDIRKARARFPQERDGRQLSRGRGIGGPSAPSRSRSRTTAPPPPLPPPPKPLEALWHIPETFPFYVSGPDSPSEVLVSYDPEGPDRILVLPISRYLLAIDAILEKETSWEILSYVLCHLPAQLSNKHLFCGPKSRAAISKMLSILCSGILSGELASHVEQWPVGLKMRDAHGLAYQTLSVLVGYRRCFELQQRHLLVEVFQAGLNGTPATIKCCLHALSLSAFELQPSMTKCLSRILEKLSQIMSNPSMAVHILGFLSIIGSLQSLHANFTEGDFKMVFGVALQFLQHYNRLHAPPTMSWALSQHVRILSYFVVYIWFLAVKLPNRPRHVRYIARQLLLANEGNAQVDEPTEVCFDWLARYTYGSADPRPANSTFSDIVTNPSHSSSDMQNNEKTWILGNAVVTIRSIARSGWVEVMSRRPSGFSRFVCRVENVPMVGPGDVAPDLLSVPAGLIMDRDPSHPMTVSDGEDMDKNDMDRESIHPLSDTDGRETEGLPQPDPITGYVWSGTAPSQRRKHVEIDPSFLILQLSPFPDGTTAPFIKRVPDQQAVNRFVRSLDNIPVIDTHKVGIMYVAPGQTNEADILQNVHGSPAYTRFLEGIGRLINLRGQVDVYAGGLDPDEDGEYAYAWWDDIGQILYHTATMMPTKSDDPLCNNKKRHIGNDYVRIVWNDSALPYRFDTLKTQFQFVNIVIEPHSVGSIAAFSNNIHENEYFKVTIQSAPGMTEFAPIGFFKLISAENLPLLVRQLSLLADWFTSIFAETKKDTERVETKTNWHSRLEVIRRFKNQVPRDDAPPDVVGRVMGQEALRDFTTSF
ncbi:hypothetical protein BDZ97DRAFT_1806083 [Flammula alnicola]|nr:hypothetical protein BDZ97DRAFT_1806083 [Flammula alnicola]